MTTGTHPFQRTAGAVNRLVPFVHVADVETSLAFYALLGFEPQSTMKDGRGRAFWALAESGKGEIMFARADGPVDARQQAVLFYMYSTDIAGLRRRLIESGLRDGGAYLGCAGANDGRGDGPGMVFEIVRRDYMPAGEMRLVDPDGYIILIGQLG